MSGQTLRQRRELRAVASVGKQADERRAHWLNPEWHDPDGYQYAHTHNTSDAFRARQIARGMKPRDK